LALFLHLGDLSLFRILYFVLKHSSTTDYTNPTNKDSSFHSCDSLSPD
jgi:hypothetical protein